MQMIDKHGMNQTGKAILANPFRYETTTPKFSNIKSASVSDMLLKLGWEASSMKAVRTRDNARQVFARHLVSYSKIGESNSRQVGQTLPRINLLNANDGTSSFQLYAGFFRLVCLNGLITGTSFQVQKINHSTHPEKIGERIANSVASIETDLRRAESVIDTWSQIETTDENALNLARLAVNLRWQVPAGIELNENQKRIREDRANDLLGVRRHEDKGNKLWEVFNRIQENTMRGGFYAVNEFLTDAQGNSPSYRRVRPIGSIVEQVRINRALWDGAEALALVG